MYVPARPVQTFKPNLMEVAPMDESYGGVSYTSNYNKPKKYLVPVIFDKYEKEEDNPTEEVTELSKLGFLW